MSKLPLKYQNKLKANQRIGVCCIQNTYLRKGGVENNLGTNLEKVFIKMPILKQPVNLDESFPWFIKVRGELCMICLKMWLKGSFHYGLARKKLTGGFGHLAFALGCGHIGGALELRLINMDERIAVGTRYFVVDPALVELHPHQGYPLAITPSQMLRWTHKPILMLILTNQCTVDADADARITLTSLSLMCIGHSCAGKGLSGGFMTYAWVGGRPS